MGLDYPEDALTEKQHTAILEYAEEHATRVAESVLAQQAAAVNRRISYLEGFLETERHNHEVSILEWQKDEAKVAQQAGELERLRKDVKVDWESEAKELHSKLVDMELERDRLREEEDGTLRWIAGMLGKALVERNRLREEVGRLTELRNEIAGWMGLNPSRLVELFGLTNFNVMRRKLQAASHPTSQTGEKA